MDRTDAAAVFFTIAGLGSLARFTLVPLDTLSLFSLFVGVTLLSLAFINAGRDGPPSRSTGDWLIIALVVAVVTSIGAAMVLLG